MALPASRGGDPVNQLTVLYNHPQDPAAFDRHYRDVHAPLAASAPGLVSYTVTHCEPGPDGSAPPFHLVAVLTWASAEALQAALGSPEVQAANEDLPNFAAAGAQLVFGSSETVV
jgi:uncharacterized protein (TIGR02118 family)